MTENDFLRAFIQPWNTPVQAHESFSEATRAAAVLICLYRHQDELHVLFTERAHHLKHHAGQVSFPGGKAEACDTDLVHTAYREAQEEIGLNTSQLKLVGQLGTHKTISGFEVTPVLSLYESSLNIEKDLILDSNEVASIFHVPLKFLMQRNHYFTEVIRHKNQPLPVHFIPYQERMIWGATASMLALLRDHIQSNL